MWTLDDFARKQLSVGSWALFNALTFKLVNLEFLELLSDSVPICTPTMSTWMHRRMERARIEKPCSVVEMQGSCICPEKKCFLFYRFFFFLPAFESRKKVKYCKDKACCSCNQKSHTDIFINGFIFIQKLAILSNRFKKKLLVSSSLCF